MAQTQHQGAQTCEDCGHLNTSAAQFCHQCGNALNTMVEPEAQEEDPLMGRELMGRYTIRRLLGVGGMGRVYVADQKLGEASREVAIKTLLPEYSRDKDIQQRFRRESSTVIALSHPNTIQFFDFGEMEDGTLFIVMEFIKGESLAHVLLRGAIEPSRVDRLMLQICGSLSEAHQMGIVHRDLKPENVLLTSAGGQADYVKVLDFGIAKQSDMANERDTRLTQQGTVLGTPPYMSPEQFSGTELDARSDIYSLGLIAYEMLTGELPFEARTPWEWATKHLTETPIDLAQYPISKGLQPGKVEAVMRALRKDREERFGSVTEFLRAFVGIDDTQSAWALATSTTTGNVLGSAPAADPQPLPNPVGTANTPRSLVTTDQQMALAGLPKKKSNRVLGFVLGAVAIGGIAGGVGVWWAGQQKGAVENDDTVASAAGALPIAADAPDEIALSPTAPDAAVAASSDAGQGVPTQATTVVENDEAEQEAEDESKLTPKQRRQLRRKRLAAKREAAARKKKEEQEAKEAKETKEVKPPDNSGNVVITRKEPNRTIVVNANSAGGVATPPAIQAVESALKSNTLTGAVDAWKKAQAMHRGHPSLPGLKREISSKGSYKVGRLLQMQKCNDARTVFKALQSIGAERAARVHFDNDWCPAK